MSPGLSVDCFEVGPLAENAYLVSDRESGAAVIVDPGEEGARLIEAVEQAGVSLEAIWLTHAHFDHIGAVGAVRRRYEVPVLIHEADLPLFVAGPRQAAAYGLALDGDQPPSGRLEEGQVLSLGRHEFTVWHTPGHSPGHVTIHGGGIALVGDCLFAGSVGRSDLPLSDPASLDRSLRRIAQLPATTRVLPGHGPATTIGRERESNPFLHLLGIGV